MDSKVYPWGDSRKFNSYSRYFKDLFGSRVQKIAVNAGFTCPNRDGTVSSGGCTFCNNNAFTPSYCDPAKSVARQIEEGVEFHSRRYKKAEKFLVYFQSFSNTYAPLKELKRIYGQAFDSENVIGVVVGTRPDCIDEAKLDYFALLAEKKYIAVEYGIESCYDSTLRSINRGHDFRCAQDAVKATAVRGIHTGAHFILGLPGETEEMMIGQTGLINDLPLDTVKFHQLQIFKDTAMGEEYLNDPSKFKLFELEEYIAFFSEILIRLRPDLVVERFAGEAPPRYHIGHKWGLVRNEQLVAMLEKFLENNDLYQGKLYRGNHPVIMT
ncbi:MAG: TIGR01212 family radical SAM protein [Rikenellaceae bacterium]|nr:TIGR01212 family radical SAM protein [Rikenellaceae bacterium]